MNVKLNDGINGGYGTVRGTSQSPTQFNHAKFLLRGKIEFQNSSENQHHSALRATEVGGGGTGRVRMADNSL